MAYKDTLTHTELRRQIAEAAYFNWLNRQHYAQKGSELTDWIEAEKEIQDSLKAKKTSDELKSHGAAEKTPVAM
jgi:hypothetical protein